MSFWKEVADDMVKTSLRQGGAWAAVATGTVIGGLPGGLIGLALYYGGLIAAGSDDDKDDRDDPPPAAALCAR